MKIKITEQGIDRTEIVIRCRQIDDEILRLKSHIELFDQKLEAKGEDTWHLINSAEVLYFEAVDDRTFLYTAEEVMEVRQRLYELERILENRDFIRVSKSKIANINQIRSLKPEPNRTILATMSNGEVLSISRKYVPAIRTLLSI